MPRFSGVPQIGDTEGRIVLRIYGVVQVAFLLWEESHNSHILPV